MSVSLIISAFSSFLNVFPEHFKGNRPRFLSAPHLVLTPDADISDVCHQYESNILACRSINEFKRQISQASNDIMVPC